MKYTILGFSQQRLLELRLGMDEAMILRWFIDFQSTGKMRKVLMEGREWMWVSYAGVLEAIPIVGGSPKTISRRFDNLERAGVLEHTTFREGGVFSVYRICENVYQTLIDDRPIEEKEEPSVEEEPLDRIVQPQTDVSNHRTELSNRWTELSEQKNLLLDSSIRFIEEPPLIPPGESTPKRSKKKKKFLTISEACEIIQEGSPSTEYFEMLRLFFQHREEIKKPMTKSALEQTIKLLAKLTNETDRIECIRLSIANGWQGVFPDKMPKGNTPHGKPSQRNMGNTDRWNKYYAEEDKRDAQQR